MYLFAVNKRVGLQRMLSAEYVFLVIYYMKIKVSVKHIHTHAFPVYTVTHTHTHTHVCVSRVLCLPCLVMTHVCLEMQSKYDSAFFLIKNTDLKENMFFINFFIKIVFIYK